VSIYVYAFNIWYIKGGSPHLIYTGNSVNVISESLLDSVPGIYKSNLHHLSDNKLVLANNQTIHICGTAFVKVGTPQGIHDVDVYVIAESSYPFILGIDYLVAHKITLNVANYSCKSQQNCSNITCSKRCVIEPNSEYLVLAKVPRQMYGIQDLSIMSHKIVKMGLFIARSVATIAANGKIPVKMLNPTKVHVCT